jgi:hypothetical protein
MLDLQMPGLSVAQSTWKSVLYAVLEACCESLEIARDDIGGTLSPTGTASWSLVLFDAVPGGAGHVIMVEERLKQVLRAALKRVSECECGRETSCYGCLRSYSNQRDHDELSRGSAADLLSRLLGPGVRADLLEDGVRQASSRDLPTAWQELYESATPEEKILIGRMAEWGVPMPEVGHETISGIPLGISWPDRQVVADIGLEDEDRAVLVEEGWTVVELNADSIREALEN